MNSDRLSVGLEIMSRKFGRICSKLLFVDKNKAAYAECAVYSDTHIPRPPWLMRRVH